MFKEQPDRCLVTAQCRFAPDIGFAPKLSAALVCGHKASKMPHWNYNPQRGLLRDPKNQTILLADHQVLQLQTMGITPWLERQERHTEVLRKMLAEYDVSECTITHFEITAFFHLAMSHEEIVDLFFDTMIPAREGFAPLCGTPYDAALRVFGDSGDKKIEAEMMPMTADQAKAAFAATPNIDQFREDRFESELAAWRDRLAKDCLYVKMVAEQEGVKTQDVPRIFRESTGELNRRATRIVRKLKKLPFESVDNQ